MRRETNLTFNGVPVVMDDSPPNAQYMAFEAVNESGDFFGLSGETVDTSKDYIHLKQVNRRHEILHRPARIAKILVGPELAVWMAGMQDQTLEIGGVTK